MAEGMAEVYGYMNREKNQKNKNKKKEFEIWLYCLWYFNFILSSQII